MFSNDTIKDVMESNELKPYSVTWNGKKIRLHSMITNFNTSQDNPIMVTVRCIDYQYKCVKVTYCHTEVDCLHDLFNHIDNIRSSCLFATYNGEKYFVVKCF